MGLLADMELAPIEANAVQRALQRFGGTAFGTAVISGVIGPLDRMVHRSTQGRATAGSLFGAMPVVMLTTVGARSGERRVQPLNAIPHEGDVALVGTNFGSGKVPAWAHNLRATPEATLTYGDREFAVVATEIEEAEHDRVFAAAIRIYAGYARYRREATNDIPIFHLKAKGPE